MGKPSTFHVGPSRILGHGDAGHEGERVTALPTTSSRRSPRRVALPSRESSIGRSVRSCFQREELAEVGLAVR